MTSQTYDGHYFWDMEIYILPFLLYTSPRLARNVLLYRYSILDKARERARAVNQKGALFAWRTINGEEASAYYAAGTAQYHINAAIAYGIMKYVDVTEDRDFLYQYGTEMLVETARLWYDLGFFSERQDGRFCIHCVTGPDEYTTVVNNNTYTNLMARENLRFAADMVDQVREASPDHYHELVRRSGFEPGEAEDWRRAAERMYVRFDARLGIHPQDDEFLEDNLMEWDYGAFEGKRGKEIRKDRSEWLLFRDGCPGGESPQDVAARADRFIAHIRNLRGDIVAFAYGHIIRMIAARWLGLPPAAGKFFYCRPASVGVLAYEHDNRDEPIIFKWNYMRLPRE